MLHVGARCRTVAWGSVCVDVDVTCAPLWQGLKRPKKARGVIMAETFSKTEKYVKRVFPKSATTKAMLRQVLSQSFMFETLSSANMEEVVDAMKERRVPAGESIIVQGMLCLWCGQLLRVAW